MTALAPAIPEEICDQCWYDLRGNVSGRCPECGAACDDASRRESFIPWAHREQIGRWSTFVDTVLLAGFRPRLLAAEAWKPVDAQKGEWRSFRHCCTIPASLAMGTCILAFTILTLDERTDPLWYWGWYYRSAVFLIAAGWTWLVLNRQCACLKMVRRSRAAVGRDAAHIERVMGHACGPVALLPVGLALAALVALAWQWVNPFEAFWIKFGACCAAAVGTVFALWWVATVRTLWYMARGRLADVAFYILAVPCAWVVVFVLYYLFFAIAATMGAYFLNM